MESVSDSCGENDPSVQFYVEFDDRRESKTVSESRTSYSEGILHDLRRRTSENKRRKSSVGEQSCKKCVII